MPSPRRWRTSSTCAARPALAAAGGRRRRPHARPAGGPARPAAGPLRGARAGAHAARPAGGDRARTRPQRRARPPGRLACPDGLAHAWLPAVEAALTALGDVVTPSAAMAGFLTHTASRRAGVHVIPLGVEPPNGPRNRRSRRAVHGRHGGEPRVLEGHRRARSTRAGSPRRSGRDLRRRRAPRPARAAAPGGRARRALPRLRPRLARGSASSTCSSCRRAPTTSRCRSWRRWRPASRSSPPASAACPSSCSTARPACSSSPATPAALAAALWSGSRDDPELRARARRGGAERGRRDFSPRTVARRTLDLYERSVRILHVIQELGTGGAERVAVSSCAAPSAAGHDVVRRRRPGTAGRRSWRPYPCRCRSSSGSRGAFPQRRTRFAEPSAKRGPTSCTRTTRGWASRPLSPRSAAGDRPASSACTACPRRTGPRPRACCALPVCRRWRAGPASTRRSSARAVAADDGPQRCRPRSARGRPLRARARAGDARSSSRSGGWRSRRTTRWRSPRCGTCRAQRWRSSVRARFAPSSSGSPQRRVLAGRVRLPGLRTDARALMGAADAIVMPSHSEGLPLSALEALASGTPLVATDVRGLRELLTDGETRCSFQKIRTR